MKVILGLGANLGSRETALWKAIERLREHVSDLVVSPLYASKPVGVLDQPTFLNLAVQGTWSGTALDLLHVVKKIEQELGRQSRERFGPREIDIDILVADDLVLDTPTLTVPHPRLHERLFALHPLADLAPELRLPGQEGTAFEQATALARDSDPESCVIHIPTAPLQELTPWWLQQAVQHMSAFVLERAFPSELAQTLIEEARWLLRRPQAVKQVYAKTDTRGSGYTPPGIERVARYGVDNDREFWDILAPDRVTNLVPSDAPAFVEAAFHTHVQLEAVAMSCLQHLDVACHTSLAQDARDGEHMLRCSRYLAGNDPARVLFPEHYDFGLLTLFGGGALPGLEAEYAGHWWPMTALNTPGNLLCGVGNTLKLYLPSLKQAFHHRVCAANSDVNERLSYSLFTEPRADVILPNGQSAGERLQRSINRIRSTV